MRPPTAVMSTPSPTPLAPSLVVPRPGVPVAGASAAGALPSGAPPIGGSPPGTSPPGASAAGDAARIARFYAAHPRGRVITDLVTRAREVAVFRAAVYREADDAQPAATGWAAAGWGIGPAFERAEDVAVARALAHLGFARAHRAGREAALGPPDRTASDADGDDAGDVDGAGALAADLALLVARAERYGLRPRRGAEWRARLRAGGDSPAALRRAEQRLRAWVERRRAEPYAGAV